MTDPEKSAQFRRDAGRVFCVVVVGLFAAAGGLVVLGWWVGRWWGLGVGAVLGLVELVVGLVAAVMLYAMSQDSA